MTPTDDVPTASGQKRMHIMFAEIDRIVAERKRQDDKWGPQCHAWHEWFSILSEEVGEVAQECNHARWRDWGSAELERAVAERMRTECCHVAAVAVAMMEHLTESIAHYDAIIGGDTRTGAPDADTDGGGR